MNFIRHHPKLSSALGCSAVIVAVGALATLFFALGGHGGTSTFDIRPTESAVSTGSSPGIRSPTNTSSPFTAEPSATPIGTQASASPAAPIDTATPTVPTEQAARAPWADNYETPEAVVPDPNYSEGISLPDAQQTIEDVFSRFPVLRHPYFGKLKVRITLGGGSIYDPATNTVVLDRVSPDFRHTTLHELVHSWQYATIGSQEVVDAIAAVVSDPQVGRQYPNLSQFLWATPYEALAKYRSGQVFTLADLRAVAGPEANGHWLVNKLPQEERTRVVYQESLDPLQDYLRDDLFDFPYPSDDSQVTYSSSADFLSSQKVQLLKARNPYWSYLISQMEISPQLQSYFDVSALVATYKDEKSYLYWMYLLGRALAYQDILAGKEQILSLFSPDQASSIEGGLVMRMQLADQEQLAEVVSYYEMLKERGNLSETSKPIDDLVALITKIASGDLTLPRFSGHLDCGEILAQRGVQDGHTIPGRVPRAGGGVSAAA